MRNEAFASELKLPWIVRFVPLRVALASTGTFERYAREWLEQQATAGLLTVDDAAAAAGDRRFTLPAEYQDRQPVRDLVDRLMGKNPEHRFQFIQSRASALSGDEIDA